MSIFQGILKKFNGIPNLKADSPHLMTRELGAIPFETAFRITHPESGTAPVLFCSPHSSADYPEEFLAASRLDPNALRKSEDMDVDVLFKDVVDLGGSLMVATFPRAFLDVNREPYELDPHMFDERLPAFVNTQSLRVLSGLGTVPRTVGDGQDIYAKKLPLAVALARIEGLYKPFHRGLERALMTMKRKHGSAILMDCHSMPSQAVQRMGQPQCDIVIGDRFGSSADSAIPDIIEHALRSAGYTVARNRPYAGGFITEHYGDPSNEVHAIQIEINRALYMDERRMIRLPTFDRLRSDLALMARDLIAFAEDWGPVSRLAAE